MADAAVVDTLGTVVRVEGDARLPFEAMWHQVVSPVTVLDLHARHVDADPAMCRLLGYDRETLLALRPADVIHPDDEPVGRNNIEGLLAGTRESFPIEIRLLHSDGSVIWVLLQTSVIREADGSPNLIVCQFHDITAYRELQVLWRRTVGNAPIGMALLNLDGGWTEVNDVLCELVGYSRAELLTMRCGDLIDHVGDKQAQATALAELRAERSASETLEVRYRHHDGHPFWMLLRLSVVPGADDRPAYLIGQYETLRGGDMRMSQERLDQLIRMALHDPLTELANRTLLIDRIEKELAELAERGGVLAVLVVDLDEFKPVNDRHGHSVGDQLLIAAAQRLVGAVRSSDTVARLGGDEFGVLARVPSAAEADGLQQRVAERLNAETSARGEHFTLSASTGLATTQNPSASPHALLHEADRAMFRTKGCNRD